MSSSLRKTKGAKATAVPAAAPSPSTAVQQVVTLGRYDFRERKATTAAPVAMTSSAKQHLQTSRRHKASAAATTPLLTMSESVGGGGASVNNAANTQAISSTTAAVTGAAAAAAAAAAAGSKAYVDDSSMMVDTPQTLHHHLHHLGGASSPASKLPSAVNSPKSKSSPLRSTASATGSSHSSLSATASMSSEGTATASTTAASSGAAGQQLDPNTGQALLSDDDMTTLRSARLLFPAAPGSINNTDADLQRELQQIRQEKNNRWNFDFASGKPLEGSYEWEQMQSQEDYSSGGSSAMDIDHHPRTRQQQHPRSLR